MVAESNRVLGQETLHEQLAMPNGYCRFASADAP